MGDIITYISFDEANTVILSDGNPYRVVESSGLYNWNAEPVQDDIPYNISVHRSYEYKPRHVTLRIAVLGATYTDVQDNVHDLLAAFASDIEGETEGILSVETESGGTYLLNVAPSTPTVERVGIKNVFANLEFVAADLYWRTTGEHTQRSFNAGTPVAVPFDNIGEVKTWPDMQITGVVNTPRFTYPSGNYIEIGTVTAAADDVLEIYTRPGEVRVDYLAGGTAAPVNWTGYAGTVSKFERLPTGAGTATIVATSGTAIFDLTWNHYWIGIQ